jgi:hypothetical protein
MAWNTNYDKEWMNNVINEIESWDDTTLEMNIKELDYVLNNPGGFRSPIVTHIIEARLDAARIIYRFREVARRRS